MATYIRIICSVALLLVYQKEEGKAKRDPILVENGLFGGEKQWKQNSAVLSFLCVSMTLELLQKEE